MVSFCRRLKKSIKNLSQYSQWVGLRQSLFFALHELINRRVLRSVVIADGQLYVCTATPDLHIAARCLLAEDYSNVEHVNPTVIVDAGANIGASAIYFAKRFPIAVVYAIEPERENYALLLENTRKYKNIIPIRAALWGDTGARILRDRHTGPWGYTVCETVEEAVTTGQVVDCITISVLLASYKLPSIDILKMDIEGGEKQVLESAQDWIDKVQVITAELHDRICFGCERAFYLATKDFARVEKSGQLVTAYRR